MTLIILWLGFGAACIVGAILTKDAKYIENINKLMECYSTTNILIAAGVIGICSRLDKLIDKARRRGKQEAHHD